MNKWLFWGSERKKPGSVEAGILKKANSAILFKI